MLHGSVVDKISECVNPTEYLCFIMILINISINEWNMNEKDIAHDFQCNYMYFLGKLALYFIQVAIRLNRRECGGVF